MSTRTKSPATSQAPSISQAMADSLGYQVNRTAKRFTAALGARLPKALTTTQVGLLAYLADHAGSCQREISDVTGIDTATLAEMLRRLETRGAIRREPDPADGRRSLVYLGELEDAALNEALEAARTVNTLAVRGLTETECATLTALLAKLHDNLS